MKTRELCPSFAARRAAATAVLLREEVLEEVGHAQWVFVMPKMLRPYFLHHRELLGGLARAGWETVLELMCAAVDDETFRPGMVAVVQTAGDLGPDARAFRQSWAQLIKRIYEVDPLVCPTCGSEMKVIAFIIDHAVVDMILRHLRRTDDVRGRDPPQETGLSAVS